MYAGQQLKFTVVLKCTKLKLDQYLSTYRLLLLLLPHCTMPCACSSASPCYPPELAKPKFIRCRFARDGSSLLYGLINAGRGPSHIAVYSPGSPGQPWQLLQTVSVREFLGYICSLV